MKWKTIAFALCTMVVVCTTTRAATVSAHPRTVAIVETDIGQYMDDTWALAALLADAALDVRMVVLSTNDTEARARIAGKLIAESEHAGRNITLVVGARESAYAGPQAAWAANYDLAAYPGRVVRANTPDNEAAVTAVLAEATAALRADNGTAHVVLVELAPPVVFGAVAARRAGAALFRTGRVHVSAMGGSFRYGYGHRPGQVPEYNVAHDVRAAQRLFRSVPARAAFALAPLDTSSLVRFEGARWERVLAHEGASEAEQQRSMVSRVLASYRVWAAECPRDPLGLMCASADPARNSGNMFDLQAAAVAGALARTGGDGSPEALARDPVGACLNMTTVRVDVDAEGRTQADSAGTEPHARPRTVALDWRDNSRFLDLLLAQILKE